MPNFDLDSFASNFNIGARSCLFMVALSLGEWLSGEMTNEKVSYFVKSSSLPEANANEILISTRGIDLKFAGKRSYSDWTVTFNCDENYIIRNAFEGWMQHIQPSNVPDNTYGTMGEYQRDLTFYMLRGNYSTPNQTTEITGSMIAGKLSLKDAWPKSVGSISFDYSSSGIATFDVTFSYNYYISKISVR